MPRLAGNPGHHPLMPHTAAGHAIEPFGIHRNDPDRMQFGVAHQIPHPGIVTFSVDEDLKNGVRLMTQFGNDGVKSVDEAVG